MIKTFSQLCLLAFLVTIFTIGLINAQASSSGLTISEVAYKGTTSEDNCKATSSSTFNCGHDKWVELYNPTSASIDLSQYRLAYGRQGSGYTENRQLSGTISPNSYFVIANKTNNALTNLPRTDLLMSNMHFMSANSGDKYVKVGLLDIKSIVIDKVELDNGQISSFESGFNFTQARFSIEIKDGIPSVNQANSYGRSPLYKNYGTPGSGLLVPTLDTSKPTPVLSPIVVVEPITVTLPPKPIELITPTKTLSAAPIALIEKVEAFTQLPIRPQAVEPVTSVEPTQILSANSVTSAVVVTPEVVIQPVQVKAPALLNSFVSGDIKSISLVQNNPINLVQNNPINPINGTDIITITSPITAPTTARNNSLDIIKTTVTPAAVVAKVNQSHYELILTLVALIVAVFVGYIVFDYNYSRIQYSNLDKFTNIVSY